MYIFKFALLNVKTVILILILGLGLQTKAANDEDAAQQFEDIFANTPVEDVSSEDSNFVMHDEVYEAPKGKLFSEAEYLRGVSSLNAFTNVIVVNSAAKGKTAQTLRFYQNGKLVLTSKVSTAVEAVLKGEFYRNIPLLGGLFRGTRDTHYAHTTRGFYTVKFTEAVHHSEESNVDMPWAVFFNNWKGIAIHQVPLKKWIPNLGHRASSGCVRAPENVAKFIFQAVNGAGKGLVPVININTGRPSLNQDGSTKMKNDFKSIVVIQNYQDL